MSVKLTFYGGVDEIGGNKILLQDGKTKIFLDFGQSFTFGSEFFTNWLAPRGIAGLGDYFEFNLLPKISGLYAKEKLSATNLPYKEPEIDAVFISHAHSDHISHLQFVDKNIPIYIGAGARLFMESMETTSPICNYGEHSWSMFHTGDKIKVGNLTVEPISVDHSIPAAYGLIIYTSVGPIVYTGDLRRHGPRKDLTENFIEEAKAVKPVAIICEGTRMAQVETRQNYSELQVRRLSNQITASTDKPVFTMRASRDIDRFNSFYAVAVKNDRKLVITPKTAHLLVKLQEDDHLKVPNPIKNDNIFVYYKKKKSGNYQDKDYFVWERDFIEKLTTSEDVKKNQCKLLIDLDFYQFAELIDIRPKSGSHFIHSMSEPFSEEDIEDKVMHNWINHFQMNFHQVHASGHMNKDQLIELVNEVNPKKTFVVHTENQKLFKTCCDSVQLIEQAKEYFLS